MGMLINFVPKTLYCVTIFVANCFEFKTRISRTLKLELLEIQAVGLQLYDKSN